MATPSNVVPVPKNEPVRAYAPGSPERDSLKAALDAVRGEGAEIPLWIGGRPVTTSRTAKVAEPHDHGRSLGTACLGDGSHVAAAAKAAAAAAPDWAAMSFEERASIFLKAADLLAGPWRDRVNAATMLGQSKTVVQAEIDAACELIDFFRFNVAYARQILELQPESAPGMWNRCEYRELEGFVLAVTPFNFTSIAGNLPTAPALMGNVCLWKPASTSLLSNWHLMQLLTEAGLPDGVINFLPGPGAAIGDPALAHPQLAGVHFTGSTGVFQGMWRAIGENIAKYRSYPRLVGETGGKDFVFAHASADVAALAVGLVRGAFEYQGQKCSAARLSDLLVRRRTLADRLPVHDEGLREELRTITRLLSEVAHEVQHVSENLHAHGLTFVGLVPALRGAIAEFVERTGIPVDLANEPVAVPLAPGADVRKARRLRPAGDARARELRGRHVPRRVLAACGHGDRGVPARPLRQVRAPVLRPSGAGRGVTDRPARIRRGCSR